jgi:F-type H+-transporting ATPase subunit beta
VPIQETIRGFAEILEGRHDKVPEQAFHMAGSLDDVMKKAKALAGG